MSSSQSSSSSASSFQGIENPDALRALLSYITQAAGGGTADYQAQRNKRNQALLALQQSMQDFSTDAASSDAAALMELNLQRSMEKAMPAISKGIQGAGTSAGSMQALMSNKIAQEAALSAGALGAEQQKAYGQILANMHGTAEEFTRIDTSNEQGLLKALDLMRIGRSQQQSSSSGASESGGGGGSRASSGGGGVAINADAAGVESAAIRRGVHEAEIGKYATAGTVVAAVTPIAGGKVRLIGDNGIFR
jgi:hypothetical protein